MTRRRAPGRRSANVRSAVSSAVRLRLVTAEKQHRFAARRLIGRRETRRVDCVRSTSHVAGSLAEEAVGGELAELALVDDMVGRVEDVAQAVVERLVRSPGPAG